MKARPLSQLALIAPRVLWGDEMVAGFFKTAGEFDT